MINIKLFCCVAFVGALAVTINAHTAGSRHLLADDDQSDASKFLDDTKNTIAEGFSKFYGGSCVVPDDQCADVVAVCKEGSCQPVWWFWAIIAAVVASLILSLVCCICCGICSCIADCLCCCCR